MKRKRKRKPVYVAEPQYAITELPPYLQKRYMAGQGFVEVRPELTRLSYNYNVRPVFGHVPTYDSYGKVWIDREEDGLFVPLSDYELRYMRRTAARLAMSELQQAQLQEDAEEEAKRQRKEEALRKWKMNDYIYRYLHQTGLWREAVKAGCRPGWLFIK